MSENSLESIEKKGSFSTQTIVLTIKGLSQDDLHSYLGQRSYNQAKKLLARNAVEVTSKTVTRGRLEYNLLAKSNQKSLFQELVKIFWRGSELFQNCSCTINWKPGKKFCAHAAVVILGIMLEDKVIYDKTDLYLSETNSNHAQNLVTDPQTQDQATMEDIKQLVDNKTLEDLKLSPAVVSILPELDEFLTLLLANGLQRVSQATLEWLNFLIIKVRINKLIKIEKGLKELQTVLVQYLQKSLVIKEFHLLNKIIKLSNQIRLTKELIKQGSHKYLPPVQIIGQARSEYFVVADIKSSLVLGVKGWISDTGYVGVTAYFLALDSESDQKLFTGSNVRPVQNISELSPLAVYTIPTHSDHSFQDLADGMFSFSNVKLNHNKNLSFHKNLLIFKSRYHKIDSSHPAVKPFVYTDWLALVEYLKEIEISPFQTNPFHRFIILEPANYTQFQLDIIEQEWKAPLLDSSGRILQLIVKNDASPHIANKIMVFKTLFKKDYLPNALFGEISYSEKELKFYPISGLFYQGIKIKPRKPPYSYRRGRSRSRRARKRLCLNFDLDGNDSILI